MCAILGINVPEKDIIARMTSAVTYRGPDDTGTYLDDRIALGHNRLSILDLTSKGHQPMQSPDGTLHIVFNGEIYNFKELRKELECDGEKFTSGTDTEVILRGYVREGIAFFKKLRGMWAFAIYDSKANQCVLSRDPFGIKPLYYYLKDKHFAFSSELRGLKPVLSRYGAHDDVLAHHLYFVFGYTPAPHTPFLEVQKILPGEIASFDLTACTLSSIGNVLPYEEDTPPQTLEEALNDTVRAHFVSDVPVSVLYSGGIDSTLLLAKARELGFNPEAFFLRIPNRLDNEYALAAAKELGIIPTVFEFTEEDARGALERTVRSLDEPFADSSYIPTEYLSLQVAHTHKVVLSGEGGDEFFGGYHRHNHLLGLTGGTRIIPRSLVRVLPARLRRVIESKLNRDPYAAYVEFVGVDEGMVSKDEALEFLRKKIKTRYDVLGLSFDQIMYLPDDLLFKIDRAGMQHGLEGRVPFLDKKFFTAVRALFPQERHGGSKTGKAMLKNLLRAYLPERFIERPKQGFSAPLSMMKSFSDELFVNALSEIERHPELVPLPQDVCKHLMNNSSTRADFLNAHPQFSYVIAMWGGWRKSFIV